MQRVFVTAAAVMAIVSTSLSLAAGAARADWGVQPIDKVLNPFVYSAQQKKYTCSAASARMALSARGISVGEIDLEKAMQLDPDKGLLSQNALAATLNRYTPRFYKVHTATSAGELSTKIQRHTLIDINKGYAVIINVTGLAEKRWKGHFVVIAGYSMSPSSGAVERYLVVDPSGRGWASKWLSFKQISFKRFADGVHWVA